VAQSKAQQDCRKIPTRRPASPLSGVSVVRRPRPAAAELGAVFWGFGARLIGTKAKPTFGPAEGRGRELNSLRSLRSVYNLASSILSDVVALCGRVRQEWKAEPRSIFD
jgi:hypothetical protein